MDYATTENFIKNNLIQKRSESWDMRYYWLQEQNTRQCFQFIWKKSSENLADYFTKRFQKNITKIFVPHTSWIFKFSQTSSSKVAGVC